MTVASLIFNAYDLKIGSQLSGLPNWAHSDGFDIEAKMDDDAVAALRKLDKKESATERRRMLQKLLADRFQLVVHHESKELPIYDLTITKNGPKLKAAPADEKAGWSMTVGGRNGRLTANSVDIAGLADALCNQLGRVVLDKTGIAGNYDLTLKWTPDGAEETADSGPSIFAALEEQLGLKLLSAKGPVDTIVVDHVEKPSPN